jgi:hypothetical protein
MPSLPQDVTSVDVERDALGLWRADDWHHQPAFILEPSGTLLLIAPPFGACTRSRGFRGQEKASRPDTPKLRNPIETLR